MISGVDGKGDIGTPHSPRAINGIRVLKRLNYITCYASVFLKNRLREERGHKNIIMIKLLITDYKKVNLYGDIHIK